MNELKTWCIGICTLLIVMAVIRFIFPESKMKSVSDSVLSLVTVLLLFSPLKSKDVYFSKSYDNIFDDYGNALTQTAQYDMALEKYIRDTITAQGIKIDELTVLCELDDEGYIIVNKIYIQPEDDKDREKIREIIKNDCEFDDEKVSFD